jgi:class 3 adenylate cyclase
MVGFTKMSSGMTPGELVQMLNSIINGFDSLIKRNNLEKIKTIGDAYFCVGGLVREYEENEANEIHPQRVINFATQMFSILFNYNVDNNTKINLRIGIDTGGAIAGVIGKKKFAYDLWDNTVNVSSKMESSGSPGKIHVSSRTYQRVVDLFEFEKCKEYVEVEGEGTFQTYFLHEKHYETPIPSINNGPVKDFTLKIRNEFEQENNLNQVF